MSESKKPWLVYDNDPHALRKMSWEAQVIQGADNLGISPARAAIEMGAYPPNGYVKFWPEPIMSDSIEAKMPNSIDLVSEKNILSDMSWAISKAIQFPVNTIFLHSLGIIASAMSKSFKFQYGQGEKPVNLYVVTAQPPSTGKSGVNEILSEPVHLAFDAINKKATAERKRIKLRISAAKKEAKGADCSEEQLAIEDEISELYRQLDSHVVYTYAMDDATPEGTTKVALKQKGIFNIISAEADAINVILGGIYSDKKSNHGVFLKGWDSERHHVVRANQEPISGHVTGTIAVIAQDESIKTILSAGELGRGISERFLIVKENTFLGKRTFREEPIDEELYARYNKLVFNIVRDSGATLNFTDMAVDLITEYRKEVEPDMGDWGKYSNNMMRGFIGKADKQIRKIASVLHVAENWQDEGNRSTTIDQFTVKNAIEIFKNITKSYMYAADELGFTGVESEYKKVEERLESYASKGKLTVSMGELRSSIKNVKPFSGTPNVTERIKEIVLPSLEENNICIFNKGKIYINPHLKA